MCVRVCVCLNTFALANVIRVERANCLVMVLEMMMMIAMVMSTFSFLAAQVVPLQGYN